MRQKLFTLMNRLKTCDAGVTLVEYGVALSVVVLLGAAAFVPVIDGINDSVEMVGDSMVDP